MTTAQTATGSILTCAHEGCGCTVTITQTCNCPGVGDHYTCACGAPLVAKDFGDASPLS